MGSAGRLGLLPRGFDHPRAQASEPFGGVKFRMLSYPMRLLQAGLLQWYALVMVFGVAGLLWYYLLH